MTAQLPHVFVVDDEAAAREMVGDSLKMHGYRVTLCDGGASLRCALVGGNLAVLAEKNGWAGIIVDGCIRDTEEINACAIGVRALAPHPQRSIRKGAGEAGLKVSIAGVAVRPVPIAQTGS